MQALFNGNAFSHTQLVFQIFNVPILSLNSLTIETSQEKSFNYGVNALPVSYGSGKKNPVAVTFNIDKTDYDALAAVALDSDLSNFAPFDIPVTWTNPKNPQSELIKNLQITGVNHSSEVDNMDIRYEITGIASHLQTV